MEPNKLDNEFRKKLEQRTIQPSEMAWDRLDAMLSITEEKKKKPNRAWMYIAASFLGFLMVATIFLKQGGESNNNAAPEVNTVAAAPENATGKATEVQETTPAGTILQEPIIKEQEAVAQTQEKAINKKVEAKAAAPSSKIENISAPAITNEAIASADDSKEINKTLTHESDNLLAQSVAQAEEVKKKSSIRVNANSLLSSVEGELDKSFKNKALQSAIKNFNSVRSSVANRNHK